jgi:hypothetical protein
MLVLTTWELISEMTGRTFVERGVGRCGWLREWWSGDRNWARLPWAVQVMAGRKRKGGSGETPLPVIDVWRMEEMTR